MDIPKDVRPLFVAAGWQSGRRVDVDGRVPRLHPAHDLLQEVGGLHVGRSEIAGIECARSDLEFCFCEVHHDILSTWSELLRSRLIGVAEVHNRHGWLLMDEAGRCFGASQMHDAFYFAKHDPCCGPISTKLTCTARHSPADTRRFLTTVPDIQGRIAICRFGPPG